MVERAIIRVGAAEKNNIENRYSQGFLGMTSLSREDLESWMIEDKRSSGGMRSREP